MGAEDWQWFGTPGHFISASKCRFRLHTRVGNYRISTVGDYHPIIDSRTGDYQEDPEPMDGGEGLYETMVFKVTGKGEGKTKSWTEISHRHYHTQQEAETGHIEVCQRYDK